MIKKIIAIILVIIIIINLLAFAAQKIGVTTFWTNAFILIGISYLFLKIIKEK